VLTGGRLTDEDAYAVSRFARDVLGTDNVDFRTAPQPDELAVLPLLAGTPASPTRRRAADVVVIAGLEPRRSCRSCTCAAQGLARTGSGSSSSDRCWARLEEIAWRGSPPRPVGRPPSPARRSPTGR
jgi:NADH-quinone oxidoreductase subunit G